jgi:hypothetical protein
MSSGDYRNHWRYEGAVAGHRCSSTTVSECMWLTVAARRESAVWLRDGRLRITPGAGLLETCPTATASQLRQQEVCSRDLRRTRKSQERSLFFPYCPAALLMGSQEGAEIVLFVASWPAPPCSRWDRWRHRLYRGAVAPSGAAILAPSPGATNMWSGAMANPRTIRVCTWPKQLLSFR